MTEVAPEPVLPFPDLDTEPYWEGLRNDELRLQRCAQCGTFQHFPSPICSSCLSFELTYAPVSGAGTVYSFIIVHRTTAAYFGLRAPYAVAWVELPEQPALRVLADLVDCEPSEVRIGMPVQAVFEPLGSGFRLVRFRPSGSATPHEQEERTDT